MNDVENNTVSKLRLALVVTSSILVSLPQLMWAMMGYRGMSIVLLECVIIVLGFLLLVLALSDPLPDRLLRLAGKVWNDNDPGAFLTRHRQKLLFAQFGLLIYLIVPYSVAIMMGYVLPTLPILLLYVVSSFLCISVIVHFYRKRYWEYRNRQWPILATLFMLSFVWTFAFWYGSPRFPTDEFTIDYYSAHLFLNGLNPYVAQNTSSLISYYQLGHNVLPVNVITPYTVGGFVTSLSYPAVSILAFVPSNLLRVLPPTATMIPFYVIPPLIVYLAYHRRKLGEIALVPVFIILLNPSYLGQVGLGYTDIIWMVFTMLSIQFYRKPVLSGLLMGVALSVKQIPWLVFPFMFIFLFREVGLKHSGRWALFSVLGFALINLYFLVLNPTAFMGALVAPEFQHIIGIGFGPSQLSFLDILPLPRIYFSLTAISILVASVLVYIIYFRRIKYAFLAFPIVIFLFNYRLLLNYLLFWPLISLLLPAIITERKNSKKEIPKAKTYRRPNLWKRMVVPILVVAILAAPALYVTASPSGNSHIVISGVQVSQLSNENVTGISMVVGLNSSNISYGDLLYRIMPASSSLDMNGYLWKSVNITYLSDGSSRIIIVPENQSQNLHWNGNYRLIIYYGYVSSAATFSLNAGNITSQNS